MASDIFDVRGWVHEKGYCYRDGGLFPNPPGTMRRYSPPEGLHRKFAKVESTPESVIQFANQYGLLGAGEIFLSPPGESMGDRNGLPGEPFESWERELRLMRRALGFWDNARETNKTTSKWLAQSVVWPPEGIRFADDPEYPITFDIRKRWVTASMKSAPSGDAFMLADWDLLAKVPHGDSRRAAMVFLQWLINHQLRGRVTPFLSIDPTLSSLNFKLGSSNLLATIWGQMSLEVVGNLTYKACEAPGCGEFFQLGGNGRKGRSDKRYCSQRCAKRAERKKAVLT